MRGKAWVFHSLGVALWILALSGCNGSTSSHGPGGPTPLAPDGREMNDTLGGCSAITLDFYDGSLNLHDITDEDFYCFTLNGDSQLDVTVEFVHADGDIDFQLLDGVGLVMDASTTEQDTEATSTLVLAGPYAVRVYSPTPEPNTYALTITATPVGPLAPDMYEPNEGIPTCAGVNLDFVEPNLTLHSASDEDFFCITLAHSGILVITADFVHANGDIDIALLDGSGNPLDQSQTQQDTEQITMSVGFGWYYLRVWSPTNETNIYSLSILKQ